MPRGPRPPLPGGPYLVVGLARSGVAAALALRARGEEVIGVDAGSSQNPELTGAVQRLSEAGVEVHLDASGDVFAARAGTLIKSPGVPQSEPTVVAARQRGVPVLGELELAWRLLPEEFIAVTGTNGKTTTSEWIGHIHREAGWPVRVVGNVGTAASSLTMEELAPETTLVCEASSFQLEDTVLFAPEVAVLLNLGVDHLDRHGTREAYVAAKLRIFVGQEEGDIAVIPDGVSLSGRQRVIRYGNGPEAELVEEIRLPGEHNRQNGLAAAAVCLARGIPADAVASGLRTFQGVAHRLEIVAVVDGVTWVNDSKATNVESTIVALQAFPGGIHLIAGGDGKRQDFTPLAPLVSQRCSAVYLIGQAAEEIRVALKDTGVPLCLSGELAGAVGEAHQAARAGETVLLSPACASYDQYRNFEDRGAQFRELVEAL